MRQARVCDGGSAAGVIDSRSNSAAAERGSQIKLHPQPAHGGLIALTSSPLAVQCDVKSCACLLLRLHCGGLHRPQLMGGTRQRTVTVSEQTATRDEPTRQHTCRSIVWNVPGTGMPSAVRTAIASQTAACSSPMANRKSSTECANSPMLTSEPGLPIDPVAVNTADSAGART